MFDLVRFAVGAGVFFGICGWAIWRGGWPERLVATALLVNALVSPLTQTHPLSRAPEMAMFVLDSAFTLLVLFTALKSDRWWPLFCCAFAFLGALTHLAQHLNIDVDQFVYMTAIVLWNYLVVFAIAGGMLELAWRKRPKPYPAQGNHPLNSW